MLISLFREPLQVTGSKPQGHSHTVKPTIEAATMGRKVKVDLAKNNAEDRLPTEVKPTSVSAAITCDPEAMFRALMRSVSTVALIQFDLLSIYFYSFKHLHSAKAVSKILLSC